MTGDRGGRLGRLRDAARHGRALGELGVASILGIVATAGFQLVAINGLEPGDFGRLASFLALINVVAVGSAALRNSVAVAVAEAAAPGAPVGSTHRDGTVVEALVLGGAGTVLVLAAAPVLSAFVPVDVLALAATAVAIIPYFFFARAQGILQGAGRTRAVVWWTTGSQVAILAATAVVVAFGGGSLAVLAGVVGMTIAFTVGCALHAARRRPVLDVRAFTAGSVVVVLLTIVFAWLTNADVILVRAGVDESIAGSYAAAGVLIKAILIIPATLGLYLLPRFVGFRGDAATSRLGVNIVVLVTLASGVVMLVGVLLLGPWIVGVLYPDSYGATVDLLPGLALMWIPWATAQAVLIRVTAARSVAGLGALLAGAAAQGVVAWVTLPDLTAFMVANGALGVLTLVALFLVHLRAARLLEPTAGSSAPPLPGGD